MARVWFVRRRNRLFALGGGPAYARPFASLQWPLDVGVHRFHGDRAPTLDPDPSPDVTAADLVLVEVLDDDLPPGSNYRPGLYSSPYSPQAAVARLGTPWSDAATSHDGSVGPA